jgi:hypothetical protein
MSDRDEIFGGKRWLVDENGNSFTVEMLYQAFKARLMEELNLRVQTWPPPGYVVSNLDGRLHKVSGDGVVTPVASTLAGLGKP